MKIAHIYPGEIPPSAYGGIERMVFWLARDMQQLGHEVTVVSQSAGDELRDLGISHTLYPSSLESLSVLLPDIDVMHFHQALPPGYQPHLPYVITEHGNHRKSQPVSPNTIFISQSHAENHRAEYFIYNGIPVVDYPYCEAKMDSMLFMAKVAWRKKNVKTAINLALDTNTVINVCGGDVWSEPKASGFWKRRAKRSHQNSLIHSRGNVAGKEKVALLQQSGMLFYIVNWQEPFALAPHEAMATGTPVICSPNGALSEYIRDSENGYLVSDYKQAIAALTRYKRLSESDRKAMYQASRATAFDIRKSAECYIDAYRCVVKDEFLYPPENARHFKYTPRKTVTVKKWFA